MKRFCSLALLVVVLGWATGVRAESVIGKYSSNGVTIQSEIAVGYKDPVFGSSVAADFADDIDSDLASAINPLGMADASQTILPASGAAKDQAQGALKSQFELGTPYGSVPIDEGRFSASFWASAWDAKNLAGNPSDAVVAALGRMSFYVDPIGMGPNIFVGQLNLPGLPPLGPYETNLQLEVLDNSVPFLTLTSGGPGAVVPLATAHNYDLVLYYKVTVPYGNDPPFAFGYTFTMSLIPEPSTFMLSALGLLGLAFVGWRRRKRE